MASVLVAADDLGAAAGIGQFLRRLGHAVGVVGGGRAALDALRREAADVLVADLRDPDGWALLHELSDDARWRRLPVVLLTSKVDPSDVAEARRLGAWRVLDAGRFSRAALGGVIRDVLGERRLGGRGTAP